jgi:hypothetical protein
MASLFKPEVVVNVISSPHTVVTIMIQLYITLYIQLYPLILKVVLKKLKSFPNPRAGIFWPIGAILCPSRRHTRASCGLIVIKK